MTADANEAGEGPVHAGVLSPLLLGAGSASQQAAITALASGAGGTGIDVTTAHPARVYAYWLGGKDHFPVDRKAGDEVMKLRPQVVAGARANRAFLARVVRFLADDRGIQQFLDIGTGLPAPASVHEVAQRITPKCRVVHVDNDPMVLVHARALLASGPDGVCDYVKADARDVATIVRKASRILNFSQPVAVLLLALLHFLPDTDDPAGVVAEVAASLAPGSYVAISHLTADFAPLEISAAARAYRELVPGGVTPRSHTQVTNLLGGLPLVAPGVVPIAEWRPTVVDPFPSEADLYGGLVRVPGGAA